jgi:hypothetical protein
MAIDQIPASPDSNSVWVCFLGTVVDNNAGVSNGLIFGMLGISACDMTKIEFVPFCPVFRLPWAMPPKSLPKAVCQIFGGSRIVHQSFIAACGFACRRVNHWHHYLGKVQAGGGSLRFQSGKFPQMHLVRKLIASCEIIVH